MSHAFWPTVISGDAWLFTQHNLYGRDNDLAYWKGTDPGDTEYYSSATDRTRIPIGTAGQEWAVNNAGTAPEWANSGVTLIEEFVAVGGETDHVFTAIPQTYRHLYSILMGREYGVAVTLASISYQFNGDTGANYESNEVVVTNNTFTQFHGAALSLAYIGVLPGASATANYPGIVEAIIPNYANATFYKSVQSVTSAIVAANVAGCRTDIYHSAWLSTAAITDVRVLLTDVTHKFVTGTIIYLYGIR